MERSRNRRRQFEAWVTPHLSALFSTALRMLRDRHDAEDLVQDTCLRAYRRLHQLDDPRRSRSWLLRILTRTYIDLYRWRQRQPELVPYVEDVGRSDTQTPEEAVLGRLLDDELKAAIESLPEEFRLAVLLADVEGLTYREVADSLDCPIGTVRSRLSRGRRLLSGLLRGIAKDRGYLKERRDGEA